MRKLREVLRLRFELHLGYQQIGAKLRDWGEHSVQILEESRGGRCNLAVAGKAWMMRESKARCFHAWRRRSKCKRHQAPRRTSPRYMSSSGNTVI